MGGACKTHDREKIMPAEFFLESLKERSLFSRARPRGKYNIKMYINDTGWGKLDLTDLAPDRNWWRSLPEPVINLRIP
jgi:hypothetical protein